MSLLDRYVLKKFLLPFGYCMIGFVSIWLIWDISSNAPEFLQNRWSFSLLLHFYLVQLPAVILLSAPVALLLGTLYSLYQMSRHQEVVAMLSSGRSLYRILLPFFLVGLLLVGVSTLLNYRYAPESEARRDQMKDEVKQGSSKGNSVHSHLFRNRSENRTWYADLLEGDHAEQVEIIQQDSEGAILEKWYAKVATFDPDQKRWDFQDGEHVTFRTSGKINQINYLDHFSRDDWKETPEQMASSQVNPDKLGVSDLEKYLQMNRDFPRDRLVPFLTHWHYRWALPWSCLVVVLFAAPLGVIISRRGIMQGVVISMVLFSSLLFLENFFLALGKGNLLPPFFAGWGPLLFIGSISGVILWMKDQGCSYEEIGRKLLQVIKVVKATFCSSYSKKKIK